MNRNNAAVLQIAGAYLKKTKPDVDFSDPAHLPVSEVLASSFDVVEFLMHLEDALGLEDEIDLDEFGPKLAQEITFAELANEVVAYLETRP